MDRVLSAIAGLADSSPFAALVAAITGVVAGILQGVITRYIVAKRSRSKTEAEEFERAIASDSLPTLGSYLRNTLGEVSLAAYLGDETARGRVNRYLRRLDEFLQLPEDAPRQTESVSEAPIEAPAGQWFQSLPQDPPPVVDAVQLLRNGEIWTALAGLRRDLERQLVGEMEPSIARRGPPYKHIEDPHVRDMTREFWYIASRAIHGDEVTVGEAALAVDLARQIYQHLHMPKATVAHP